MECEVYFSTRYGRKLPRGMNEHRTPEDMEKVNERNAQRRLMRLILTNFCRENGDLFVTFTYGESVTEEEAKKGERNLLARIRRLREKKGLEALKYIAITEKQGKWHHHVIMNGGLTLEDIKQVWGERGKRISLSVLDDSYSYEDLSKYLVKSHKPKKGAEGEAAEENQKQARQKGERRWHGSRNLKQPKETKRTLKRAPRPGEPKARKGYRLLPNWYFGCDCYGFLYRYAAYVAEAGVSEPRTKGGECNIHGQTSVDTDGVVLPAGGQVRGGVGGRRRDHTGADAGKDGEHGAAGAVRADAES